MYSSPGDEEPKYMKRKKIVFDNKRAVETIVGNLLERGVRQRDAHMVQAHLLPRTQMLVPIMPDPNLFNCALKKEIDRVLRKKGSIDNTDYRDWVEAMQWMFTSPMYGRISLFIRKHHLSMGIVLTIVVFVLDKFKI